MLVPEGDPQQEEARGDMASRAGGQQEAGRCRGLQAIGPLLEGDANGLHSYAYNTPGRAVGKLMTLDTSLLPHLKSRKLDLSGTSHSKSQKLVLSGRSRSESLKLGPQARGSKGIGKLPEELLAKILGILDPKMLMAARLVCRAFRAASIPSITALQYQSWTAQGPTSANDLACRLQVFTSVCTLDLGINLFSIPYFFEARGVLSKLRRLQLSRPEMELCADELRHRATAIAAATQLTALEVSRELWEVPGFGILLPGTLEACTALRDLRLEICETPEQVDVWEGLLGKSALLSRLEALGSVVLYGKADFEAVGRPDAAHPPLSGCPLSKDAASHAALQPYILAIAARGWRVAQWGQTLYHG
eukprot:jgi/Botrbrau1/13824/Bobra.0056s0066.1